MKPLRSTSIGIPGSLFAFAFFVAASLFAVRASAADIYWPGQTDFNSTKYQPDVSDPYVMARSDYVQAASGIWFEVLLQGDGPFPDGAAAAISVQVNGVTVDAQHPISFAAGEASKTFTVTADYRMVNLPLGSSSGFGYKIFARGWATPVNDPGFNVNATVTVPAPNSSEPPLVTIIEPANPEYHFSYDDAAHGRATIVLSYDAVSLRSSPVNGRVDANYDGPGISPANGQVDLSVASVTLGTALNGSGQTVQIETSRVVGTMVVTREGDYVVSARATNSTGPGSAVKGFRVVIDGAPIPTVSFNSPTEGQEFTAQLNQDGNFTKAHVVTEISASDSLALLQSWGSAEFGKVTLSGPVNQNYPITPAAPAGNSALGSLTMDLTASGLYALSVTVTNEAGGTATANRSFWVNKIENPRDASTDALSPIGVSFEIKFTGKPGASYSYQWQRRTSGGSFADITYAADGVAAFSGAQSNKLGIASPRGGMNGEQYRCLVSGGAQTIESGAATLTVRKLNQAISYTAHPTATIGDSSFNLAASVGPDSARALAYSSSLPSVATVDGTGEVTINSAGTTLLTIRQDGDENYNSASASTSLEVKPLVAPLPTVSINSPLTDLPLPSGQTTVPVLLSFASTPNTGFAISRVVAVLDGTTYDSSLGDFSSAPALPSTTATTSTRTVNLGAGSHTLAVTSYIGNIASPMATVTFAVVVPTCGTAMVQHAAVLNGQALIRGSLKIMTGEKMALDGQAWITDTLYLPGTPTVKLTGQSIINSTVSAGGSASPSKYTLTLNGNAAIGTLVTQSNPVPILPVATPPYSAGTRNVTINKAGDSLGDPATIRDLKINGNVGAVTLPPGTYRDVTVTGKNILVLTAGTYNIRELKLDGADEVQVQGAVVINVAKDVKFNGKWGTSTNPSLVKLNIADGGLTLNGKGQFYGFVNAPSGEVTLNGMDLLKGGLIADKLTINGQGVVELCDTH